MEDDLIINTLEIISGEADKLDSSNGEQLSSELSYLHNRLKETDHLQKDHELVKEIRNVAFLAENIIDQWQYDAYSITKSWKILERCWKILERCFRSGPKYDLGKNIEDFMEKTSAIREGKAIHEGIKKLTTEENGSGHLKDSIPEEADVVGFTEEVNELVRQLTSEESKRALSAISIVGMAGLGKSTLAYKIYKHDSVKGKFKHRAWIHDQENPRSGLLYEENRLSVLLLSILECFDKLTKDRKEMHENDLRKELEDYLNDLRKELEDYLNGKTYLVVVDNVRRLEIWDVLKAFLPDHNNGSRILLTTRATNVALRANSDRKEPPHYLGFREKEESWELFKRKAFQGGTCTKKWEELGRRIAEKCDGLPLAIKVLGDCLRDERKADKETRKKEAYEREVYYRWCSRASSYLYYTESSEFKGLWTLSYNYLPSYMKPCFLYLSVFPEDYPIPARQLIQLWVAEGFIAKYANETMEETASRYLVRLADQGLIIVLQRTLSDNKVKTCRIHSLYRDFCISEARKENFALHVNDDEGPVEFPRRLVVDAGKVNDDEGPVEFPRRLEGDAGKVKQRNVEKLQQLRSLLCFSHVSGTSEEWSRLLQTTKLLKVFNVSHVSILPDTVGNLPLLTYLGLDKNSLQQIPASVCNLPNLQVLDARSKFLPTAPDWIWKLKEIKHVYFKGPTFLPPPPSPVSSSTCSPLRRTLSSLLLKFKFKKTIPRSPSLNSQSQLQPQPPLPLLQSQSLTSPPPKSLNTIIPNDTVINIPPAATVTTKACTITASETVTTSSNTSTIIASDIVPFTIPATTRTTSETNTVSTTTSTSPPMPLLSSQSKAQPVEQPSSPLPSPPPPSESLPPSSSNSQSQSKSQLQTVKPPPIPPPPPPPPPTLRQPQTQSLSSESQPQPQQAKQPPPPPPLSSSPDGNHEDDPYSLKHLQTLSTISAESCTKEVLQRLPNLLKLGIMVKGYLNSLSDNLVLLKNLQTLKLVGAIDFPPLITLPLKFPPNLIKLTLTETKLEEDPMPLLGELEKLEVLKLSKYAYSGTEMVFSPNSFQQLKRLKLAGLEYITKLETNKGALPNLEQLFLYDCHCLKEFIGIQHLEKLQDVYLKDLTTELTEKLMQPTDRPIRFHNHQLQ